jgi:hypothetical protein
VLAITITVIITITITIIIIVIVRQLFPKNSDPAIYVQQNKLGLFVSGPLN